MISQVRRAIISVCSNIAEGSSRKSKKDQAHFYTIAYGSLAAQLSSRFQKPLATHPVQNNKGNTQPDHAEEETGDHVTGVMDLEVDPAHGDQGGK